VRRLFAETKSFAYVTFSGNLLVLHDSVNFIPLSLRLIDPVLGSFFLVDGFLFDFKLLILSDYGLNFGLHHLFCFLTRNHLLYIIVVPQSLIWRFFNLFCVGKV